METKDDTTNAAAAQVNALAARAAEHGRSFMLAVSPAALTRVMVAAFRADARAWRSAHVFLADTRFDACGCGEEEAHRLLRELPVPRSRLYLDTADIACPVRGAAAFEQRLRAFFGLAVGDLPLFDAVLLHIDSPGEAARLQGGAGALDDTMRIAVPGRRSAGAAPYVTLSPAVIRYARSVVVTTCGGHTVLRSPMRGGLPAGIFAGPNVTLHAA
ncbi:MAG: 6-phosphogluconolactonase [Burkholderiales bacterium]